jgi:DNA uptake protein ComE-like DNA-binding protein
MQEETSVKSADELILTFFNTATTDELTIMNGCSRKKADLIVEMRPFANWDDLVVHTFDTSVSANFSSIVSNDI